MSEKSIHELCAPISAKQMPQSALYHSDHTPRTNEQAMSKQRTSESVRVWKRQKTKRELGV